MTSTDKSENRELKVTFLADRDDMERFDRLAKEHFRSRTGHLNFLIKEEIEYVR